MVYEAVLKFLKRLGILIMILKKRKYLTQLCHL